MVWFFLHHSRKKHGLYMVLPQSRRESVRIWLRRIDRRFSISPQLLFQLTCIEVFIAWDSFFNPFNDLNSGSMQLSGNSASSRSSSTSSSTVLLPAMFSRSLIEVSLVFWRPWSRLSFLFCKTIYQKPISTILLLKYKTVPTRTLFKLYNWPQLFLCKTSFTYPCAQSLL